MGFVLRSSRAFILILTSALLWASFAWAAPSRRLDEEAEPTAAEELLTTEYEPLTYARSTQGEILPELFDVAAAVDTWKCPACGYENKANARFCVKCGARLTKETPGGKIYCPQCSAASAEGSNFCTACGYAFKEKKPGLSATPAPPVHRMAIYFTGGLASYGSTKVEYEGVRRTDDVGNSWAAGGGLTTTLLTWPGVTQSSLRLSSDVGCSTINHEFEGNLEGSAFKISLIPMRETVLLSLGVGPRNMVKPFCGAGGGIGILIWEYRSVWYEATLDDGTSVKPLLVIPFGCEFDVTPNFALGVRADYLIIPGDIEAELEYQRYPVRGNVSIPDVFILGATARYGFF